MTNSIASLDAACWPVRSLARLPMGAAVDLVLQAAYKRILAECQPDAAQAHTDPLRFEAEAAEFQSAHCDPKSPSESRGKTAKVFVDWLDARAGEPDFDRRPDPAANSVEAVEIVRWHASKGQEWPMAVVAELDYGVEERAGCTAPVDGRYRYSAASSDTVRSPFTASSATRALKPASWFLRFRIPDLLVFGDQQTSDRSFRHCPISGE